MCDTAYSEVLTCPHSNRSASTSGNTRWSLPGSLRDDRRRAPSGPLTAQIGICDPCNHECVFCWDHPPRDRQDADTANRFGLDRPGIMPLERLKGIVDDLHALGTRRIDLIGRGEPLLNRSALDMIRYAKGLGMQVVMCTNGSRLFEPIARELVAARADRLNISLNAGTPRPTRTST